MTRPADEPKSLVARPVYSPSILAEDTLPTQAMKRLSPRLKELVAMLEYSRPERSDTEEAFIARYIDTLPNVRADAYGNRIVKVGRAEPTVCFTSHTDTVAYDEGKQALEIQEDGSLGLDYGSLGDCLGADCGAGVWLMRRLILAGKPGLYIFHRDEESGGQGSTWIAENTPELVASIDAMISLDRRGYDSVITKQSTGTTASNLFAKALARQLGGSFKPDPTGSFTDSAFYSHLIPECTNLSIGYHNCHSSMETLDFDFTDSLLVRLLKLDTSSLEIHRQPEPQRHYGYTSYYNTTRYSEGTRDYDRWTDYLANEENAVPYADYDPAAPDSEDDNGYSNNSLSYDRDLAALVRRHPEACAILLAQWDLGSGDLYEAIRLMGERA